MRARSSELVPISSRHDGVRHPDREAHCEKVDCQGEIQRVVVHGVGGLKHTTHAASSGETDVLGEEVKQQTRVFENGSSAESCTKKYQIQGGGKHFLAFGVV